LQFGEGLAAALASQVAAVACTGSKPVAAMPKEIATNADSRRGLFRESSAGIASTDPILRRLAIGVSEFALSMG
jgi:hypothetical protein